MSDQTVTEINSLQNARVKNVVRLRDGRQRQNQGRFVIDGVREVTRALASGIEISEIFCEKGVELPQACPPLAGETALFHACKEVFRKMAFGDRHEGILAVAKTPDWNLNNRDLQLPPNPLVAVIEGIEKPGNIGAVIRSADAAGVDAVILADCRSDPFNPNAIRASLGTVLTLPIRQATAPEVLAWLRKHKLAIFAARVDGSAPYTDADFSGGAAIVLGSEADGLSQAWQGEDVRALRLPMLGVADSLNISATAAVLFFEALRQRNQTEKSTADG